MRESAPATLGANYGNNWPRPGKGASCRIMDRKHIRHSAKTDDIIAIFGTKTNIEGKHFMIPLFVKNLARIIKILV